jgi:hypothetical protein
MKPLAYGQFFASQNGPKLKSGLAPTGVSRHVLVTTQQFQLSIYAAGNQKTNVPLAPY